MHTSPSRFRRHFRQAAKFGMSGLIGAFIEFSILYLLVTRLQITPVVAYIFSGGVPALFVFLFNRHITFRAADLSSRRQSKRFILVYVCTSGLNYVLSTSFYLAGVHVVLPLVLAQAYGVTEHEIAYAAKVLAIGVTAIVNYTFSHLFIFKKD